MDISSALSAKLSIERQNVSLSLVKQSADAEIANILDQALRVTPADRGAAVNFSV